MMKKIMATLFVLVCCWSSFGENTNKWMPLKTQLNQLDTRLQRFERHPGAFGDSLVGPHPLAFTELQNMMKESWPIALEHLEQIATNDVQKVALLLSSWELPEDEFTEFLTQVADMVEAGKLDWQLLKWTSSPFNSGRENYDLKNDKHIKAIIQRVRELKPSAQP